MNHKNPAPFIMCILFVLFAKTVFANNANVTTERCTHFFIQNKGQWPDDVLYLARLSGLDAWITKSGVVYDHHTFVQNMEPDILLLLPDQERNRVELENTMRYGHVVKMAFEGSNPNAACRGNEQKPGYLNYLKGNESKKWVSHVPVYGQIEVLQAFEGISVKYYFDNGHLRYDFYLQPGADLSLLKFSLDGYNALEINEEGELQIETSLGLVTHGGLYAYQFYDGAENEVVCRFIENLDGTLGIKADNYNPDVELVVDPLVFSTYLGGNADDIARSVKQAHDGSIISSGFTYGQDFPVTPGAYQTAPNSSTDMFITKLTPDLSDLVFSTYIGGNDLELLYDMSLGNDGSIFITGWTSSSNYPVTPNAYQPAHGGGSDDAFVTRLHPDGGSLVYSTYLGGSDFDYGTKIVVNDNFEAIVLGTTASQINFPVTPGALQAEYGGAFLSKFNSMGTELVYSATIDGIGNNGMTVDEEGKVYIAGSAHEYNFPITPGAFQETCPQSGGCASIVVINPNATAILYSTFLGGNNSDEARAITLANSGDAVVGGYTQSPDFPVSPNAFQTSHSGFLDIFVARLNPTLTTLVWSTFVGGFSAEMCNGIVLDNTENVYFTGHTQSYNYPVTPGAFQSTGVSYSAIISKLNSDGTSLLYSTYLGGNNDDRGFSIDLVQNDQVVIAGSSSSSDFPVSPDAYQINHQGNIDAFVTRLITSNCAMTLLAEINAHVSCNGGSNGIATIEPSGGYPPYTFLWSDGQTGATAVNFEAGTYQVLVTDSIGCEAFDSITIEEPLLLVVDQIDTTPTSCQDSSDGTATVLVSGGTTPYSLLWSNDETGDTAVAFAAGDHFVLVTDTNGCEETLEFSIDHIPSVIPQIMDMLPASCSFSLDGFAHGAATQGTAPYTYLWSNGETGEEAFSLPSGENTLTIMDANGCQENLVFEIDYIQPFGEEHICAVTVNPATGKNTIMWQKTENVRTDAYNIYRESSASGTYELIGTTLYDEPPVYEDLQANSLQQSYRYKLAVVDSCQAESELSTYHRTIHLSMNEGINNEVNLLWTPYVGTEYPTQFIMRSLDNGPFVQIGLVPSTNLSFTDIAPPTGFKKYMVEIEVPDGCGELREAMRIQSNTVVYDPSGIGYLNGKQAFKVYPNPGKGLFKLEFEKFIHHDQIEIQVFDHLGNLLYYRFLHPGISGYEMDLQHLPDGVYQLRLKGSSLSGGLKLVKF